MNEKELIRCIELQLGRRAVRTEDRFQEDLGAESIDMLHIIAEIESRTGIFIPEEMIPEFTSVQILYQYLKKQQA